MGTFNNEQSYCLFLKAARLKKTMQGYSQVSLGRIHIRSKRSIVMDFGRECIYSSSLVTLKDAYIHCTFESFIPRVFSKSREPSGFYQDVVSLQFSNREGPRWLHHWKMVNPLYDLTTFVAPFFVNKV